MIKDLVSIIIPTYNRAEWVTEAIESVKAQTYSTKQIIVVDDGSRDETQERLKQLEGFQYIFQSNQGQGAARNAGLRIAKGEFVASLDSDDLWDRDFLERSVQCLETFQLDFVFNNWLRLKNHRTYISEWLRDGKWKQYQKWLVGEWSLLTSEEIKRLFLQRCPAPASSVVVRRSSIASGWGEHMKIADDWYFLLNMALRKQCTAAFTLTPRWKKRIYGDNVYDGVPYDEVIRKLYLHDHEIFRREFAPLLTTTEHMKLRAKIMSYRLRLRAHDFVRTDFARSLKLATVLSARRRRTNRHLEELEN